MAILHHRLAPRAILQPHFLFACALLVHACGRVAAFCAPFKLDSFYYAVSAWHFWQPDLTLAGLIPDKPGGQALLSGWCYRLWPGAPSRLVLVPIESVFMIAGYGFFWLLARRLFGERIAAFLVLCLVLGHNSYSALETVTDGFNLNESYMLAPLALAALAHLGMTRGARRAIVRGLAVGVALSIKQSAVVLLVAIAVHDTFDAAMHRSWRAWRNDWAVSLAAIVAALAPLGIVLQARGVLLPHVRQLAALSGLHLGGRQTRLQWDELIPLAPLFVLVLLAIVTWEHLPPARQARPEGAPWPPLPFSLRSSCLFALLWLIGEVLALRSLAMPAMHYYQQIVAPGALAAGFAALRLDRSARCWPARDRVQTVRWTAPVLLGATLFCVMPLLAAASVRVHGFDLQEEIASFAHWIDTWSPSTAAGHLRR